MKEGNKHTILFTHFGPIWPTLGERTTLECTKLKVIQKGYKKLA